jgi:hypothetical protein
MLGALWALTDTNRVSRCVESDRRLLGSWSSIVNGFSSLRMSLTFKFLYNGSQSLFELELSKGIPS